MKVNRIPWEDIIQRLRTRTVPAGYTYCTYKKVNSQTNVFVFKLLTLNCRSY